MVWGVPAAKTEVNAPTKRYKVINNTNLFVMSPEEDLLSNLIR